MSLPAALALLLAAAPAHASDPVTAPESQPSTDPDSPPSTFDHERIEKVKTIAQTGGDPPISLSDSMQQTLSNMPKEDYDKTTGILSGIRTRGGKVDPDSVGLAVSIAEGRRLYDEDGNRHHGGDGGGHGFRSQHHEGRHFDPADPSSSLRNSREAKWDNATLKEVPPSHKGYGDAQTGLGVQAQLSGDNRGAYVHYQNALNSGQTEPRTLTFAALSALNAGEPEKAANWSAWALKQDPKGPLAEQATAINKMAENRMPRQDDVRPPLTSENAAPPSRPAAAPAATNIPELDRPLLPRPAEPALPKEALAVVAETNRLVAQASKAYRAGDIKEAAAKATEALAKDPDDVRALQVHAAAMAKEGRWDEVKRDADHALDIAPGYVPMLLLRAAASVHAKDWRAVRHDADEVLAKEKANPTAWRFRGIAQAGLGERAAASTSLSRAAQYGDPEAPRLLASLRSLPPGADVVDLVEMLAGSVAQREGSAAPKAAAAAPASKGKRLLLVAGGLVLLVGRRDSESA